eukprot:TRINITY_DN21532_c0_g1_i1.p1 TRINITY_DN21532_c0_g1~~TRINITY_DN21532_c0_g1_i1.p1  ORF type:complete len:409 (+),score=166.92 TRINITY_DN21532_c0_g1_i1:116-1228(+)
MGKTMGWRSAAFTAVGIVMMLRLFRTNIKQWVLDFIRGHYLSSITSGGPDLFLKWYSHDPLLMKSSLELIALRESMKLTAPLITSVWAFRRLCADAHLFMPSGAERLTNATAGTSQVPCCWVEWPGVDRREKGAVVLYLHGGGYVAGHPSKYRGFLGKVSRDTRIPTFAVDYRLVYTGKTTVKDCVDDCLVAYNHLLGQGFTPKDIVLCGDSAGGGLVVSLLQRLRDEQQGQPLCGVCISPFVDATFSSESCRVNGSKDLLITSALQSAIKQYLSEAEGNDLKSAPASPIYASMSGLAPLFVSASTTESLYDDALGLTRKARDSLVEVELHTAEGYSTHIDPCMSSLYPEAEVMRTEMCNYINKKLASRR